MLGEYRRILGSIPAVLMPLMRPFSERVDEALKPGISSLTWMSLNVDTCELSIECWFQGLKNERIWLIFKMKDACFLFGANVQVKLFLPLSLILVWALTNFGPLGYFGTYFYSNFFSIWLAYFSFSFIIFFLGASKEMHSHYYLWQKSAKNNNNHSLLIFLFFFSYCGFSELFFSRQIMKIQDQTT